MFWQSSQSVEKVFNSRDNCNNVWFVWRKKYQVWRSTEEGGESEGVGDGKLSILPPSPFLIHTSLGTCRSWPMSQERRMVMSKGMSMSMLLGGGGCVCVWESPQQQALLDGNLTWKHWLQIGAAVSEYACDFAGDHRVGARTRVLMIRTRRVCLVCRMAGAVQRTLQPLISFRPHSSSSPVDCPGGSSDKTLRFHRRGRGLIPGRGIKIPHAAQGRKGGNGASAGLIGSEASGLCAFASPSLVSSFSSLQGPSDGGRREKGPWKVLLGRSCLELVATSKGRMKGIF